jgi:hypothetical protein
MNSSGRRTASTASPARTCGDESQQVARNWRAKVTAHVFVLDSSGAMAYQGAPDEDHRDQALDAQWLRAALDDVLAGRAASLADAYALTCRVYRLADGRLSPTPDPAQLAQATAARFGR